MISNLYGPLSVVYVNGKRDGAAHGGLVETLAQTTTALR